MRSAIFIAAVPCIAAVDTLSLLQQHVAVDVNDYDYDDAVDYAGKGKAGKQTPTDAPPPAPTDAPTVAPTPPGVFPNTPGVCTASSGELVPAGQVPYAGMTACHTTTW